MYIYLYVCVCVYRNARQQAHALLTCYIHVCSLRLFKTANHTCIEKDKEIGVKEHVLSHLTCCIYTCKCILKNSHTATRTATHTATRTATRKHCNTHNNAHMEKDKEMRAKQRTRPWFSFDEDDDDPREQVFLSCVYAYEKICCICSYLYLTTKTTTIHVSRYFYYVYEYRMIYCV